MKLTDKEKFNEVYGLTKQITGLSEIYSNSALYVENRLPDNGVEKAFATLIARLTKQLNTLRKEAKE